MRGIKIVITLGPSSNPCIEDLVIEGADVFRLNFSHSSHQEHEKRIRTIQATAVKSGRYVIILGGLQGPKIRVGGFQEKTVRLDTGDMFAIHGHLGMGNGSGREVSCSHTNLTDQLSVDGASVLGDGEVEFKIPEVA